MIDALVQISSQDVRIGAGRKDILKKRGAGCLKALSA